MRNTFWSLVLFIFQLSLLASSVHLFVVKEELHISLLAEMSHLQQQCLPGGSDHICRKGFILQVTSWKYLHCPFSYPKATSNEIKTRILKFSLTICGESEKSPGKWKSYPLQYSGLDYSMDCKNCGTAKSLTKLSAYNVPFVSEKNIHFSVISVIGIDCGHRKSGKKWKKRKTKTCQEGREEFGVLDMNPGFAWKWGDTVRKCECRHWWWLHSTVKALIFPNCFN